MKKILIILLCIFYITICSCNKPEKEETNNSTSITNEKNNTNTTLMQKENSKMKLKKDDKFTGNINIENTINNKVFFQKIDFTQIVNLNFIMNVINASSTGYEIEVEFKDCSINSELKDLNTPEITNPFETLNQFAENLNGKSFNLIINENGKVLNIKNWKIDEKYNSDKEALNEINKYFSKSSLSMIFEKITYTGPKIIEKDDSWNYNFSLNNTIPIQSLCNYDCIDVNDYYYVVNVENSNQNKTTTSKITFPHIYGNAKISDNPKGDLLISKSKGILKKALITFDCNANVSDLVLLNLKLPTSIDLSPLTIMKIEMNIPIL